MQMKKLLYIIAALIICAVLQIFSSCKKEKLTIPPSTYSGKLTAITTQGKIAYDLQITFNENNFTTTGTFKNAGTFERTKKDKVIFVNTSQIPIDANANFYLNGDYSFEAKGDSIILTKNFEVTAAIYPTLSIQYKLKLIN
jgi:hypothetical protein